MKKQRITLRLESHRPSSTKCSADAVGRMAREMDLNITARGHYKKTNQMKITLISGPHVHKKSRDQYKIDRFGAFLVLGGFGLQPTSDNNSAGERDKFLEWKNKLYRLNLDQGFSPTLTYLNRETLVI